MQITPARGPSNPSVSPSSLRLARDYEVSVVIPTLNEAKNLPAVVGRIDAALAGRSHEIIIVDDDSRDGTQSVCEALARQYSVRLVVRRGAKDGLGGAVLRGIDAARGDKLVVLDADLQHPPEKIPELLGALDGGAEFVIGSRYVGGASTDETWGRFRRWNSRLATWLAGPFAGGTADPMSGFFALRRETYERASGLAPVGYKIGLELLCKCRVRRITEVPIDFGQRAAGESKLDARQQARYLRHLGRLYAFTFPRATAAGIAMASAAAWWELGRIAHPAVGGVVAIAAGLLLTLAARPKIAERARRVRTDDHVMAFSDLRASSKAA